jgi:ABC-type amino acid transport substrate-binding protein
MAGRPRSPIMKPQLWPLLLAVPALAACDRLPRDTAGTTDRITRSGEMRIAVMPATPDAASALAVLGDYARRHDARLTRVSAHGEHALRWLEKGKVDAVVGHFAQASPWQADVALSKPVGRGEPPDTEQPVLRVARRNGENALILATDRAIAEVAK